MNHYFAMFTFMVYFRFAGQTIGRNCNNSVAYFCTSMELIEQLVPAHKQDTYKARVEQYMRMAFEAKFV